MHWIGRGWLDIEATIKALYGRQEGAEIGYNPHKPGRPSHVLPTFWVGNVRLVLEAQLSAGKQHASTHAKAALVRVLDQFGEQHRPALVRGDCSFGNEPIIEVCEARAQPYLFRLRRTANVKRLVERLFSRAGWSQARRVVVLRRRLKHDIALTAQAGGRRESQLVLSLPYDGVEDDAQVWEYAVLVTNAAYELAAIGQLYRDRCDCENGFDELKNQWGWGGFSTQDMASSQISARAVALVYNWWSWYVRAAHPQARREALTSRPLLLAAVGRAVSHAGQTLLYLTPMHAETGLIKSMIANIHAALTHVRAIAPQLPTTNRWATLLAYICRRIVNTFAMPTPPPALQTSG